MVMQPKGRRVDNPQGNYRAKSLEVVIWQILYVKSLVQIIYHEKKFQLAYVYTPLGIGVKSFFMHMNEIPDLSNRDTYVPRCIKVPTVVIPKLLSRSWNQAKKWRHMILTEFSGNEPTQGVV